MIPYKDDNPTSTFPFVTIGIIVLNIFIFLFEATSQSNMKDVTYAFGAIPHNILTFEKNQPIHPALTIFSSMFMHGGLFHLGGNMLYLWIFGDGSTSQDQTPVHTYPDYGTYTVTLDASNACGPNSWNRTLELDRFIFLPLITRVNP